LPFDIITKDEKYEVQLNIANTTLTQHLTNCLAQCYHIYISDAAADKDELIRFWRQKFTLSIVKNHLFKIASFRRRCSGQWFVWLKVSCIREICRLFLSLQWN